MATTALTVVNNVLARLRENQVTSVTFATNTYAQLILRFVNEAKQEVEDAWDWTALRQTLTVTTSAGTSTYTVTGAGQRFRFYDPNRVIINATNKTWILPQSQPTMELAKWTYSVSNQIPCWYRFIGESGGDPVLELYPTPDATYSLKVPLIIPDADLSAYSDTFKLPLLPVELRAWAKAISERGEDAGQNSVEQLEIAEDVLASHIARDAGLVEGEMQWQPY